MRTQSNYKSNEREVIVTGQNGVTNVNTYNRGGLERKYKKISWRSAHRIMRLFEKYAENVQYYFSDNSVQVFSTFPEIIE